MDAVARKPIPPLEEIIHLVFMFHETNAYAVHGSTEQTAALREHERILYYCHGVSRETVQNYAASYNRDAVLSFFRNDLTYLEMEKAFARAPHEKFNILRSLTSFWSPTRIEGKHVRTIPVADYHRAMVELNSLPREHRYV